MMRPNHPARAIRVVVDTNVFVSAALKADSAPRYAIQWIERWCVVLKSDATEQELHRTLAKPKLGRFLNDADFIRRLTQMVNTAERVAIIGRIQACRDPDDDKFLEVAVNGHADIIISGDDDLLSLRQFQGIPIIGCAAFIKSTTR